MPNIRIENVPDDVLRVLQRRAATAGLSCEEYVRGVLVETARQPTVDEILAGVGQRSGGAFSAGFAVAALRADRDAH